MTWSEVAKLWERTSHPRIAQACEALEQTPFVGDVEAWLVAARMVKAGDLPARGPLIATLLDGKLDEVSRKLEASSKWRDPRLDAQLERALREVPWSSNTSRACWNALFKLVTASRNPRFVVLQKELPPTWQVRSLQRAWLESHFASAVEGLPAAHGELTAEELAQLEALQKTLKPRAAPVKKKGGAIDFAAVYANPADDAPRLVLADALLEANDPRGEFLSLQLRGTAKSAAETKRERALLKAHQKEWLAPFGPSLGADVEWRRGFPVGGLVKFKNPTEVAKYGSLPEWATFERLAWSAARSPEHAASAGHIGPAFRHVLHAENVHVPTLLASKTTYALRSLQGVVGGLAGLEALRTSGLVPRLEALALDDPFLTPDWVDAVAQWTTLRELGVTTTYPPTLLQVLARAEKLLTLERLRWGNALVFHRDAQGRFGRVELRDFRGSYLVAEQLSRLPDGCITEFVEPPNSHWATGPLGRTLERLSQKHASVSSIDAAARQHLDLNGVLHAVATDRRVVVGSSSAVCVVDADALEVTRRLSSQIAVPTANDVLLFDGAMKLRSLLDGSERAVPFEGAVRMLARSADGSRFAVADEKRVSVMELATGAVLLRTNGTFPQLDRTGARLLVSREAEQVLHELDAGTSSVLEGAGFHQWLADGRRAQVKIDALVIFGDAPLRLPKLTNLHCRVISSADGSRLAALYPTETHVFDGVTGARLGAAPGGYIGAFDARGVIYVTSGQSLAKAGPFKS